MKDWRLYQAMAQREGNQLLQTPLELITSKDKAAYLAFEQENASMPDSLKEKDDFKQYAAGMKRAESNHVAMNLNSLAWDYYQMATTTKDLTQVLQWSGKLLQYDRKAAYLNTYAHLCRRLERKTQAIEFTKEAISTAKGTGESATDYEQSLAELKGMK